VKATSSWHPLVLMTYFISTLFLTMFTMHPVFLALSLLGALSFFAMLGKPKAFLMNLLFYLPMFILIAVVNPLFSHNGETPLFFLNDQAITLEAILYGIAIAGMLVAVMFWFKCYNEIMTSDKFIYLFGRVIPKLALILSMALRFVPLFIEQTKKIHSVQKTMGLYTTKSLTDRFLGGVRVFYAILQWSLENAVETADSMKARGYGLKGRTNFAIFRFRPRDGIMLAVILSLTGAVSVGLISGNADFFFYPSVTPLTWELITIVLYSVMAVLVLIPLIFEVKESLKWKFLRAKI